ncbi:MAG TPA: hypothetical protein VFK50_08260 [Sphingomicrobium sp.]|nr:hypothetical protein [Sphingomicrobium sp.]
MTADSALGPEWLAHRYDETSDQLRFVDYDRATRASVPFLTDQYLPPRPFRPLGRNEARAAAPATAPIHFIFHSGFCCSTLLAACLDQPGLATSFSEPMILNDIVGWRTRGAVPAAVGRLLDDALALLARPFPGDGAAIIKPSTIVNGLASAVLQLRRDAQAICIHAPLEDFVTSIAKKGLDGRLWARELFLAMRRQGLTHRLGFDDSATFGQTDLQIAALAWLGQQALFADLADAFPERARTISSVQFLADPEETLRAAGALFGLTVGKAQLEAARSGPMQRNSKDMRQFRDADRDQEYERARQTYGDEITKVAIWAAEVAKAASLPLNLPNSLLCGA